MNGESKLDTIEPLQVTTIFRDDINHSFLRIKKSITNTMNRCNLQKNNNRIPIRVFINLFEKYTKLPLQGKYKVIILTGDLFSPVSNCENLIVNDRGKFEFDTKIPLFKGESLNGYLRSSLYLIIHKSERISITRINIDPEFIFSHKDYYPIYFEKITRSPTIIDKVADNYEGFSEQNDFLATLVKVGDSNVLKIDVSIEE